MVFVFQLKFSCLPLFELIAPCQLFASAAPARLCVTAGVDRLMLNRTMAESGIGMGAWAIKNDKQI